jgi:hypothetical protein
VTERAPARVGRTSEGSSPTLSPSSPPLPKARARSQDAHQQHAARVRSSHDAISVTYACPLGLDHRTRIGVTPLVR